MYEWDCYSNVCKNHLTLILFALILMKNVNMMYVEKNSSQEYHHKLIFSFFISLEISFFFVVDDDDLMS